MPFSRTVKFCTYREQSKTNATFSYQPSYNFGYRRKFVNYKNGTALQGHADSAHGGEVLDTCPACIEIRQKQEKLNAGISKPVHSESYPTS